MWTNQKHRSEAWLYSTTSVFGCAGGLAYTLKAIVKATIPSPRYVRYHERHLQRFLSRLGAAPPRSTARHVKRIEALRECHKMISASAGGCCTAFPFEAAIWLWEEKEELYGGGSGPTAVQPQMQVRKYLFRRVVVESEQ